MASKLHAILLIHLVSVNVCYSESIRDLKPTTKLGEIKKLINEKKLFKITNYLGSLGEEWPTEEFVSKLPETFTVFIKVGKDMNEMSLRQFLLRYLQENLQVELKLPQSYRNVMELPAVVSCLKTTYTDVAAIISGGKHFHKKWTTKHENLICQWGNKSSVTVMANSKDAQDFEKEQQVKLNQNDCLYAPENSIVTLESTDPSWTVLMSWDSEKEDEASSECSKSEKLKTIGDFSEENSSDFEVKILEYYLAILGVNDGGSDFEKFFDILTKDGIFTAIKDWNSERQKLVKELFGLLDVNNDGRFSMEDLDFLTKKDLYSLAKKQNAQYEAIQSGKEPVHVVDEQPEEQPQPEDHLPEDDDGNVKIENGEKEEDSQDGGNLQGEFDSAMADAFNQALEEAMKDPEIMKELDYELNRLKKMGVNIGDVKKLMSQMEVSLSQKKDDPKPEEATNADDDGAEDQKVKEEL